MIKKSKYTNWIKEEIVKIQSHFLTCHIKKVYCKIDDGWPAFITVKLLMRENFSDDFTVIIASVENLGKLIWDLDSKRKID